ncbi:hypothetical protein FB451DRAFT_1164046 [Mycena latifolia]|nr:hypothetical protein FB451DRAFT_1164046 [Mycena latifolia]
MALPSLPLDLLPLILWHIPDIGSLLTLCLVSHTFLHAAQPELYAHVALQTDTVLIFCRTVTAAATLAARVRSLSFPLSPTLSETDIAALARMLRSLPGLRALEIGPHWQPAWAPAAFHPANQFFAFEPWPHRESAAHILRGAPFPFRLAAFRTGFTLAAPDVQAFLAAQPEIEELASLDVTPGEEAVLPAGVLPNLRLFQTAVAWLEFAQDDEVEAGSGSTKKRVVQQERMDLWLV